MTTVDHASSDLPPLYERWLGDVLSTLPDRETRATCADCAMCSPGEDSSDYFQPDVKCCSFRPLLPGFAVGAALRDPTSEALIDAQIGARVGVTPLGIGPSRVDELIYQHGKTRGFGRSRALVCPYLSTDGDATCGVWRHRNAICATYFCKHDRGATGAELWAAVRGLLSVVEQELSWHCAVELGLAPSALRTLADQQAAPPSITAAELDGAIDEQTYRALWANWLGRERELYERSAVLVEALSWRDVARICGPTVEARARAVRHAQLACSDQVPARLALADLRIRIADPDVVRVETYSASDPIEMPRLLFDALRHFDGRPNETSLASILEHDGVELDEELVQRLVDFRILTAPGN